MVHGFQCNKKKSDLTLDIVVLKQNVVDQRNLDGESLFQCIGTKESSLGWRGLIFFTTVVLKALVSGFSLPGKS